MTTLFGKSSTDKVSLPNDVVSSSATQAWSSSNSDGLALGVPGIFGCGSIVIASRKGIWMSHHWQDGFDDDDTVNEQVVEPLSAGNSAMQPALPSTAKSVFTSDDKVQVLFLTPQAVQNVPPGLENPDGYKDMFNYEDKMTGAVKNKLKTILPDNTNYLSPIQYKLPQNTDSGEQILKDNADNDEGPEASQAWQDFVNK